MGLFTGLSESEMDDRKKFFDEEFAELFSLLNQAEDFREAGMTIDAAIIVEDITERLKQVEALFDEFDVDWRKDEDA